jgi:hypothetical protein
MKFTRENLQKEMAENANKQAYYAFIGEASQIIPSFKGMMNEVKTGMHPVLTVAGLLALKLRKREISEEKVKGFIRLSADNPEQATSFWASLPKVLDVSVQWYKSNNRFYSVERDAIAYLSNFMTDEQLSVIAEKAHERNEELRLKAEAEAEKIKQAKDLFA